MHELADDVRGAFACRRIEHDDLWPGTALPIEPMRRGNSAGSR